MAHRFAEIAFTPRVRALQERDGSRRHYARLEASGGPNAELSPREAAFLARAESAFLATVGETGWPYVQHRGGPPGFLRVLSSRRIAFADFRGNRQLVSAGNAACDDRAALIVVNHATRERLKLLGHLRFLELAAADPGLEEAVVPRGYDARVERIASFDVEAFDWNCPQHIPELFTRADLEAVTAPLRAHVARLEAELRELRR